MNERERMDLGATVRLRRSGQLAEVWARSYSGQVWVVLLERTHARRRRVTG